MAFYLVGGLLLRRRIGIYGWVLSFIMGAFVTVWGWIQELIRARVQDKKVTKNEDQ